LALPRNKTPKTGVQKEYRGLEPRINNPTTPFYQLAATRPFTIFPIKQPKGNPGKEGVDCPSVSDSLSRYIRPKLEGSSQSVTDEVKNATVLHKTNNNVLITQAQTKQN
jgi:hypothetical protein